MSRRMIRWTRSDAENGMRADSCPSDKPEGGGERGRKEAATRRVPSRNGEQKGRRRCGGGEGGRNSIEFVEQGRRVGASFLFMH